MEALFSSLCEYAYDAHWIIFLLLMLAGLNVPISEDILLVTGGAIASSCIPDQTLHLYTWIYFGCWISAWEVYWLGRLLGPKLYHIAWFARIADPARVDRLHGYYEKFGVLTFVVGRFIPGGVRNALFMSCGLCKMHFFKFILRDGFACLISSATLFYIGFIFGQNHQQIIHYLKTYNYVVIAILLSVIVALISRYYYRKSNKEIE